MENRKYGSTDVSFDTIGEPRISVLTGHVRVGPGTCARGVRVEGLMHLYLDADDRVLGVQFTAILPSNVRPPPKEAT